MQDLEAKQKSILDLASTMVNMTDTDQLLATARQLEADGAELQALALAFESQEKAKAPPERKAGTVVVLTPSQRARVKEETGIEMTEVMLPDNEGIMAQMMPNTHPKTIELRALEQARRQAAQHYSEQQARIEMFQHLADIEASGPEAAEMLAKLKEDPHFLNGLLQKK